MSVGDNMDTATSFLDKKVDIDFCDPTTLHDRILLAQGKKFYVISMNLAMHSEYFYGLFNSGFQEKDQIELKEVDANTFELFLKMLHHQEIEVNGENLANLTILTNKFLAPIILQKCVKLQLVPSVNDNMDMEPSFIDKNVDIDFCDPTTLHDRILLAQGKKFYVISMNLAMHSEYFYGLFNSGFQEKDQPEIELKEVDAKVFELFLKMLHHQEIEVNRENLTNLISLSNMFLAPIIWQMCVKLLKKPETASYFQLEELFELLNLPGSDGLRPVIEDRCMEIFLSGSKLSEFLKIVEEYKFARLMECIIREISSKAHRPCRDILELVLMNTEFAKFKDVLEERNRNREIDDTAVLLHVIILLSKYDLRELQKFFNYYFFVKQPSAEVVEQLMYRILSLSTEHKNSFKKMLHNTAMYFMNNGPPTYTDVQGIANMLLEFSYLFRHCRSEYTLQQAHKLGIRFFCNFEMSDVKEFFDAKWAMMFSLIVDFKYIKFVLEQNLTQSKMQIEKYFEFYYNDIIKRRVSLLRYMAASEMVDQFVRDSLKKNQFGTAILEKIFI